MRTGILACGTRLQTTHSGRRWLRGARRVARESEDQNPHDAGDESNPPEDEPADRSPSPATVPMAAGIPSAWKESHHGGGRPEHPAHHESDERQIAVEQRP